MKYLILLLCLFTTGIAGCDTPDCPDSEKYIGGWDCTTSGSVTSCTPQWYCPETSVPESLPCIEENSFGCEPFVNCMPTARGWKYLKAKF